MIRAASTLDINPMHEGSRRILESGATALTALLEGDRRPDWAWFEIVVGDDACRLPEALIRAGAALGREEELTLGLSTLDWMLEQNRCPAETMTEACEAAFAATGDPAWRSRATTMKRIVSSPQQRRPGSYVSAEAAA